MDRSATDPSTVVSARTAVREDEATILVLGQLARDEAFPERGGELLLLHDNGDIAFDERLQAAHGDDQLVVVGAIDSVVVGYAIARQQSQGGVRSAMIEEIMVHPEARSVGVAAAMLQQVIDWARRGKCDVIESQVLPGNRSAKNFFERVGMVTRKMQVSARLR